MMLTRMSERENRLIDFDEDGSMEQKERGVLLMDERQLIETDIQAFLTRTNENYCVSLR